jgi:hypothetical protein
LAQKRAAYRKDAMKQPESLRKRMSAKLLLTEAT